MPEIIGPFTPCLGDSWALVSHAARTSVLEKRQVEVSAHTISSAASNPGIPRRGQCIRGKLAEILAVLNVGEGRVTIVDDAATSMRRITVDAFPHPYPPTRRRWDGGGGGRACYQLSNNQLPEHCDRAPSRREREEIEQWLGAEFDEVIRLGANRSIFECVEVAASSELFVGMDSGMSHLCHSVGVPVLIKEWVDLDKHHPSKEFQRFSSADEAISMMEGIRSGT
jgi:hypothetical protein